MGLFASDFLNFQLPNSATWFYLSLVLVVGLFFRFDRSFHLRNLDLIALFLLVPALLFLRDGQQQKRAHSEAVMLAQANLVMESTAAIAPAGSVGIAATVERMAWAEWQLREAQREYQRNERSIWQAYLFLLLGSGYFLIRCLFDLGLVRRPLFVPNLNSGGLIWIGATVLIVLSIKAVVPAWEPAPASSRPNVLLEQTKRVVTETAAGGVPDAVVAESGLEVETLVQGSLAIACHLAVIAALVFIGAKHFQSRIAGIGAACLYLLLPYTAYYVNDLLHIVPAALLVGAVALYRKPTFAGVLLGVGAAAVYFPLVLFPLWLGFYRRRCGLRFSVAFLLGVAAIGIYRLLDGVTANTWSGAISLPDWQAFNFYAQPQAEGLWTGLDLHFAYRAPLFFGYLCVAVGAAFWPSPKNLAHLIALSATLVIGVQLWYADAGGIYVLWYLPLLILVGVRPALADHLAPEIDPQTDWLHRLRRRLGARLAAPGRQPALAAAHGEGGRS